MRAWLRLERRAGAGAGIGIGIADAHSSALCTVLAPALAGWLGGGNNDAWVLGSTAGGGRSAVRGLIKQTQ